MLRVGRTFFVHIKYRIPHQGDLNPVSGNTKILPEPGFIFCASVSTNRGKSMQDVQHSPYDGSSLLFAVFFPSCFLFVFLSFPTGKGSIDKANAEVRNIILRIWPKTPLELLDRVVQPPGTRKYLSLWYQVHWKWEDFLPANTIWIARFRKVVAESRE